MFPPRVVVPLWSVLGEAVELGQVLLDVADVELLELAGHLHLAERLSAGRRAASPAADRPAT